MSGYPEGAVVRVEDFGPIERAYAEAMHEDCSDPPAGHPLARHSPWSGGDLDGAATWPSFVACLARHGLVLGAVGGEPPEAVRLATALHDAFVYCMRPEALSRDVCGPSGRSFEDVHLAVARRVVELLGAAAQADRGDLGPTQDELAAELDAALDAEIDRPPDPADLARWLQDTIESQPAITIRQGVEPQVAWRALADELLRRWGRP